MEGRCGRGRPQGNLIGSERVQWKRGGQAKQSGKGSGWLERTVDDSIYQRPSRLRQMMMMMMMMIALG